MGVAFRRNFDHAKKSIAAHPRFDYNLNVKEDEGAGQDKHTCLTPLP
jgi:hypothetical protein